MHIQGKFLSLKQPQLSKICSNICWVNTEQKPFSSCFLRCFHVVKVKFCFRKRERRSSSQVALAMHVHANNLDSPQGNKNAVTCKPQREVATLGSRDELKSQPADLGKAQHQLLRQCYLQGPESTNGFQDEKKTGMIIEV